VRRVVILGDSNGFGWGVPLGQTFGGIIDSSLACTEVINLALSGYGIDQSLLRFIEEGIAFHPDVVILQVTPNDFEEIQYSFFNQKPKPQFRLQEDGTLELSNVPVQAIGPKAQEFYDNSLPLPFQKWLDWNSYAFNALNGIYYQYRRKLSSQPAAQGKIFTPESIVLFNAIANELAAQLQAIGADGILVHTSGAIHAAGGVSATGLKVLDLHEHFESAAASVPERRYFSDGYHWNAVGHKVVAEELMKVVGSTGACGERLKAE
jgi:lysophospholipase L1-like esterase